MPNTPVPRRHSHGFCDSEYWVVDLNENRVLLHANPRGDGSGYDGQLDVLFGETLYSVAIEGLAVETSGLE